MTDQPAAQALEACPSPWCESVERGNDFAPAIRLHHFGNYRVVCPSCILEGPPRPRPSEAITAWNTRTPSKREAALVEALGDVRARLLELRPYVHSPNFVEHFATGLLKTVNDALLTPDQQ